MQCPKCGSNNVNVQLINEQTLKNAHHSIFWWLFCSWWIWIWWIFKWVFLTLPALIGAFSKNKKQQIKNKTVSYGTCQTCGYHWKIQHSLTDTILDSIPAEAAVSPKFRSDVIRNGIPPRFCAECGSPVQGTPKFCTECGATLKYLPEETKK